MPNHLIRRLVIFGALSILGIVVIQGYWLQRTFSVQDDDFNQRVHFALRSVAQKLSEFNQSDLPKYNVVKRQASNTYIVNIDDNINTYILEDYLYRELQKIGIDADFEYHIYDCYNEELVFGNYCYNSQSGYKEKKVSNEKLPVFKDLTYYFIVKFPSRTSYLVSNMRQNLLFSLITFMALLFFLYSMWVILQQKKLSELQKDFINNMTHEFKTPISSIKIASNYLTKDATIGDHPKLRRYAEIISEQNERLNSQVENVLSLAKLESDNFKLNKESFDAIQSLKNIVKAENVKLTKGRIILDNKCISQKIVADKLHFTNVIHNVIDNATKYCNADPQIKIHIQCHEALSIKIIDNGIGIERDHLDKVFKKFYRVFTGDVHDVKGFGLGLYYVKNICAAHGWTIEVSSKVGAGSIFNIKIPLTT